MDPLGEMLMILIYIKLYNRMYLHNLKSIQRPSHAYIFSYMAVIFDLISQLSQPIKSKI